jgi:hypothetical protein
MDRVHDHPAPGRRFDDGTPGYLDGGVQRGG